MITTWKQYCENIGGGLPSTPTNYSQSARFSGEFNGTIDVGQANVHVVGNSLQIDTADHSISLILTPDQVKQLQAEFQS